MDRPWLDTLPSLLCQSIRGCHSYCGIRGPSMNGWTPCLPPTVKVSVDASYCVHPWTNHRWYTVLGAASWCPEDFHFCNLSLHDNTTATIENMTCVYHGAFMRKYAGMFHHRHVHATIVQFVCRISHVST